MVFEAFEDVAERLCHAAAACWMYLRAVAESMRKISYAGYRFPPEVIHQAVWLYLRFTLSFRMRSGISTKSI